MKRSLLLLLVLMLLPLSPALAQMPEPGVTIALESTFAEAPPKHITDAAFTSWLRALLEVDAPCTQPIELRPAHRRFLVTFTEADGTQTQYGLWHDSLYDQATVTHPDGDMHRIDPAVPDMLLDMMYDTVRFGVKEAHRALLADHGWTVAYRLPMLMTQLPTKLEASRTDAAALYFTYADLFLRDAGYDITPFLGKAVTPYVYRVYERVDRIAWFPEDASLHEADGSGGVQCGMQAVVLECEGQLIGAYMRAISWDGSHMLSLDRRSPIDLLGGASLREYLLSRLSITEEEQTLAALTPEEVLRQYARVNDPRLQTIEQSLCRQHSVDGVTLFPGLFAVPTGQTALTAKPFESRPGVYDVSGEGWHYFPEMVLESPETGWKILHFYNTGF